MALRTVAILPEAAREVRPDDSPSRLRGRVIVMLRPVPIAPLRLTVLQRVRHARRKAQPHRQEPHSTRGSTRRIPRQAGHRSAALDASASAGRRRSRATVHGQAPTTDHWFLSGCSRKANTPASRGFQDRLGGRREPRGDAVEVGVATAKRNPKGGRAARKKGPRNNINELTDHRILCIKRGGTQGADFERFLSCRSATDRLSLVGCLQATDHDRPASSPDVPRVAPGESEEANQASGCPRAT
jgi:hypothetical protein